MNVIRKGVYREDKKVKPAWTLVNNYGEFYNHVQPKVNSGLQKLDRHYMTKPVSDFQVNVQEDKYELPQL